MDLWESTVFYGRLSADLASPGGALVLSQALLSTGGGLLNHLHRNKVDRVAADAGESTSLVGWPKCDA